MSSGLNAGAGFVEVVGEYGLKLFVVGSANLVTTAASF